MPAKVLLKVAFGRLMAESLWYGAPSQTGGIAGLFLVKIHAQSGGARNKNASTEKQGKLVKLAVLGVFC